MQNGKRDFAVVLSGFIGRGMDRYARLRLGQEIEGYFKLYGITLPKIEDYNIESRDTSGGKKPAAREASSRKQGSRNDAVTHFVRKVALLATDGLPEGIKPNKNSRRANQHKGTNIRYYHLWYSKQPWGNWQICYDIQIEFDPSKGTDSCDNAFVAIRYSFDKQGKIGGLSVDESDTLKNILDNVDIQEGQRSYHRNRWGRVQVDFGSHVLDEVFAKSLADTLRRFIKVVTPAVDNFMNERNEEYT